jgi:endonuclease-3
MNGDRLALTEAVDQLTRLYTPGPILTDPLQQILWENIGYLIDDERRQALFDQFAARVGLSPRQILNADPNTLNDIAVRGGMRPQTRIERWRTIAELVLAEGRGDLMVSLSTLPPTKARALVKQFPAIADPGADKILLFAGISVQPCLDSNGLRALARLGFFAEQKSYAASYRAAIEVLRSQGRMERDWLIEAYLALRDHGRRTCKRGAPLCPRCPLDAACAHAAVAAL